MPTRLTGLTSRIPPFAVLAKFAVTGGTVAAVQFGLVIVLVLIGVPIQLALALTMVVVLCLHFTLNRQWVFASQAGYAFHLSGQGVRYLVAAGVSYGGVALGTAVLPDLLGVPELAGFMLASAVMTVVNFAALHLWIFRTTNPPRDSAE